MNDDASQRTDMTADDSARAKQGFRVDQGTAQDGIAAVRLSGNVASSDGARLWREIRSPLRGAARDAVRFDLSGVESMDGGAMALLVQTQSDLRRAGRTSQIVGGRSAVQKILELYEAKAEPRPPTPPTPVGFLGQVGNATVHVVLEVQLLFAFLGSTIVALAGILRRPRTGNWTEVASIMNRTGADAVPIVVLINFLVGFVMGFQSAVQLKQFGANIYVADLVGLSTTRELGPLMTAIIVCGRSGAAFAAELGTMKVSEEIDALRTMGFGPLRFLVFPRVVGLFLVMPVLTLVGDVVGIGGGLLVGVLSLDLTAGGYLRETQQALHLWDVFQGLIKGGVFAIAIGIISCQQGLSTTGGAEGVGRRTTASVVASLFAIILVDAAFTVLFHAVHV